MLTKATTLTKAGAAPIVPGCHNRKRTIRYDKRRYYGRHLVENVFYRLCDFRQVAIE
ncbi:hypothetical protein [Sphingomonas xinjiangensis]|uniref:Transposase n=1 Tax=Sphingomonas xinjiangensis TaxID=643568 RepID=A0A840YR94_9SPHN|nr:hypothetical protein [Sphingomonas xinjiangensis]MBB5712061.1 hypothetical protein [Sphingomonas xinjiangensis]